MTEPSGLVKVQPFTYGDKVSPFHFSKTDILIPFHGQYNKVRALVESILLFTTSNPYLVTLIDDASPNATFWETLGKMAPVRVIRLNEQKGFAGALKAGFDKTNNPWVVFMHSDCKVADRLWLQRLGEAALRLKEQNVRLVHSRTDNPGMEHSLLTPTLHQQNHQDRIVTEDEPLPLITAMVHRELFNHIGGFLKPYPLAGYEDVELFYRMKKRGMKQAVAGESWVHHDGSATINDVISHNKKAKSIMEANYETCLHDIG